MITHQSHRRTTVLLAAALTLLGGCAVSPDRGHIPAHAPVDLQAFMGQWYVIASIPTFIEKGAHNAIESYALDPDGTINTTFTFRADGFDGKEKRYNPRGFVVSESGNAVWGMRFVWPIKAEYVICWVDPQYSETIIGRSARDYVWIMARTPTLGAERYEALLARVRDLGYDVSKVQKVPQRW